MGKRDKIGGFYVERRSDGTFENWSNIQKALRRDRLKKAVRKVKPGYGHLGDQAGSSALGQSNILSGDFLRLDNLKKLVKQGVITGGEWDEYDELGRKLYPKIHTSKKFRSKFYAGDF